MTDRECPAHIEKAWATEQNTTALAVPHMRQRVNVKDMASSARCFFASEACGSAVYEGGGAEPESDCEDAFVDGGRSRPAASVVGMPLRVDGVLNDPFQRR